MRMAWCKALLVLLVVASGCATRSVHMTVLEPSPVSLPAHVKTVAVIDRSAAGSTAEHVAAGIEGVLTGEALLADREAAARATSGVASALQASPRFDVVVPNVSPRQVETSIFDQPMSWSTARRIAREAGAQAVLALEVFNTEHSMGTDVEVKTSKDSQGRDVRETVHVATRNTNAVAVWRVYDVETQQIVDELVGQRTSGSWSGRGESQPAALGALPAQAHTSGQLAHGLGQTYGRRIAPSYRRVQRTYYAKGSRELRQASRHVRAGDWDGAQEIWAGLTEHHKARVRGRAALDTALWHELRGDLHTALEWAQHAAVELNNGVARGYVRTLRRRIEAEARLAEQLRVEEPPPRPPAGRSPSRGDTRGEDGRSRPPSGTRSRPPR